MSNVKFRLSDLRNLNKRLRDFVFFGKNHATFASFFVQLFISVFSVAVSTKFSSRKMECVTDRSDQREPTRRWTLRRRITFALLYFGLQSHTCDLKITSHTLAIYCTGLWLDFIGFYALSNPVPIHLILYRKGLQSWLIVLNLNCAAI